ncbi:MAG: septum formation initiator family protein [Gemmatimonadota bacterium]|nr:MAG: septum formation initiator family protein [Gemmatimonadota bacterium]
MMGKKRAKSRKGKGKKRTRTPRQQERTGGRRFIDITIVAMLLLAAYFAVFGGEYSVFELRSLENLEQERAAELATTGAEIDSLRAVAAQLENDPEAIEREARERYGMIRDGEILYRFREAAPPDSTTNEDDEGEGGP